jgi:hypothetical protein
MADQKVFELKDTRLVNAVQIAIQQYLCAYKKWREYPSKELADIAKSQNPYHTLWTLGTIEKPQFFVGPYNSKGVYRCRRVTHMIKLAKTEKWDEPQLTRLLQIYSYTILFDKNNSSKKFKQELMVNMARYYGRTNLGGGFFKKYDDQTERFVCDKLAGALNIIAISHTETFKQQIHYITKYISSRLVDVDGFVTVLKEQAQAIDTFVKAEEEKAKTQNESGTPLETFNPSK